jgi:hypothetical protein
MFDDEFGVAVGIDWVLRGGLASVMGRRSGMPYVAQELENTKFLQSLDHLATAHRKVADTKS